MSTGQVCALQPLRDEVFQNEEHQKLVLGYVKTVDCFVVEPSPATMKEKTVIMRKKK
jgi:hypothetical protein